MRLPPGAAQGVQWPRDRPTRRPVRRPRRELSTREAVGCGGSAPWTRPMQSARTAAVAPAPMRDRTNAMPAWRRQGWLDMNCADMAGHELTARPTSTTASPPTAMRKAATANRRRLQRTMAMTAPAMSAIATRTPAAIATTVAFVARSCSPRCQSSGNVDESERVHNLVSRDPDAQTRLSGAADGEGGVREDELPVAARGPLRCLGRDLLEPGGVETERRRPRRSARWSSPRLRRGPCQLGPLEACGRPGTPFRQPPTWTRYSSARSTTSPRTERNRTSQWGASMCVPMTRR